MFCIFLSSSQRCLTLVFDGLDELPEAALSVLMQLRLCRDTIVPATPVHLCVMMIMRITRPVLWHSVPPTSVIVFPLPSQQFIQRVITTKYLDVAQHIQLDAQIVADVVASCFHISIDVNELTAICRAVQTQIADELDGESLHLTTNTLGTKRQLRSTIDCSSDLCSFSTDAAGDDDARWSFVSSAVRSASTARLGGAVARGGDPPWLDALTPRGLQVLLAAHRCSLRKRRPTPHQRSKRKSWDRMELCAQLAADHCGGQGVVGVSSWVASEWAPFVEAHLQQLAAFGLVRPHTHCVDRFKCVARDAEVDWAARRIDGIAPLTRRRRKAPRRTDDDDDR